MSRAFGVAILLVVLSAACGGDDESSPDDTASGRRDCQTALSKSSMADEGELVDEVPSTDATICTVRFSAGDDAIGYLGFNSTDCDPTASILVKFRLFLGSAFEVDRQATVAQDNGDCVLSEAP